VICERRPETSDGLARGRRDVDVTRKLSSKPSSLAGIITICNNGEITYFLNALAFSFLRTRDITYAGYLLVNHNNTSRSSLPVGSGHREVVDNVP
jgi:hypothetical protein